MKRKCDKVLEEYVKYMRSVKGLSERSIDSYRSDIGSYLAFLEARGIEAVKAGTKTARSFVAFLTRSRKQPSSINRVISALRGFYRYLLNEELCSADPFDAVMTIKKQRKLPEVLFEEELEELLKNEDLGFVPLRDRLIVEMLYSTGCRVSELIGVDLGDLDLKERTLLVRGKGSKERIVFLGQPSLKVLKAYLPYRGARVYRGDLDSEKALFLNMKGRRLTRRGVAEIVKKWALDRGVQKPVTPHTFRHSFATHVMDRGADIRVVQELLGHAKLSTTQVYTHLGIERLRNIYTGAHPHAGKEAPGPEPRTAVRPSNRTSLPDQANGREGQPSSTLDRATKTGESKS